MKTDSTTCWQRLEKVMKDLKTTPNSFAKHIGLIRGENLYQIKRGNNRISLDVACRIHDIYPQYAISWLMCGEVGGAMLLDCDIPVVRIPIYQNTQGQPLMLSDDDPENYLIVSASIANGAEFALPYAEIVLDIFPHNTLLLLLAHKEEIIYNCIYLIETADGQMCRIIQADPDPECLLLYPIKGDRSDSIQIPRDAIPSLWLVCGTVSKFCR